MRAGRGEAPARAGGQDELRLLTAPVVKETCLTELIRQIRGEQTVFPQRMLFDSTRTALEIQRCAEE